MVGDRENKIKIVVMCSYENYRWCRGQELLRSTLDLGVMSGEALLVSGKGGCMARSEGQG